MEFAEETEVVTQDILGRLRSGPLEVSTNEVNQPRVGLNVFR